MLNRHSAPFIRVNAEFPNIGERLASSWGTRECVEYLHELQHDTRGEARAGFPVEVLFAIAELEARHNAEYPAIARKDVDS
jgi:hypothetical protein